MKHRLMSMAPRTQGGTSHSAGKAALLTECTLGTSSCYSHNITCLYMFTCSNLPRGVNSLYIEIFNEVRKCMSVLEL